MVLSRFDSQLVEFKKRDDYWGEPIQVETVQFVPAGQAGNIETQITDGRIDFAEGGAPGVVTGFAGAAQTNRYAWVADGVSHGVTFMTGDPDRPTFDLNIRKALRHSIDPNVMQEAAGPGLGDQELPYLGGQAS